MQNFSWRLCGNVEGKNITSIEVIDSPIDVVTINDLDIKLLDDQNSTSFGGIATEAHDLSIENVSVELKKISNLSGYSGGFFGKVNYLELNNSKMLLNEKIMGNIDDCTDGFIGGVFGEVQNSEVRNLTVDLNSKNIEMVLCKHIGAVEGGQSIQIFST